MLGKLLKYEFKATGRILLPLYGLMIITALIAGLTLGPDAGTVSAIITMIFVGIAVASMVMTLIITIQRFSNNLLTDEGYLMFTLPVSTANLIISKLIAAVCWFIVGTLAGFVSGLAISVRAIDWLQIGDFFQALGHMFNLITAGDVLLMLELILCVIVSYGVFVLAIYLSLSIGQLPFAGKHRKGASLLAFFGIYIIYMVVSAILGNIFDGVHLQLPDTALFGLALLVEIVVAGLLFFATHFILDKHLNLE